jgi:hypothetical protein
VEITLIRCPGCRCGRISANASESQVLNPVAGDMGDHDRNSLLRLSKTHLMTIRQGLLSRYIEDRVRSRVNATVSNSTPANEQRSALQ